MKSNERKYSKKMIIWKWKEMKIIWNKCENEKNKGQRK